MSSTVTASARLFTAANTEYFSATDAAWNSPTGSWLQCGWVKFTSVGATQIVGISKYGAGGDDAFQPHITAGGAIALNQSHNGTAFVTATEGGTRSAGVWYFVEYWYDATNQVIGVRVNRGTAATTAQTNGQFNSTLAIQLGRNATFGFYADYALGPWAFFNGSIPSSTILDSLYNSGSGKLWNDLVTADKTDLIAWYDGVETSGQLIDASGNAHHLTDNNTVTSAVGKVTYTAEDASQFTAANSEYLSRADSAELSVADGVEFTIGGWYYFNTLPGGGMHLIGKWTPGTEYLLWMNGAVPTLQSNSGTQNCTWGSSLTTSTWYFIVGGRNSSGGFINVNQGTPVTNASYNTSDSSSAFTIGAHADASRALDGRAAACFFYKTTSATATQLDTIYARGFGVDYSDLTAAETANLISWWELTESSGNRADSHGSNTLTDNNTVTGNPGVVYDVPAVYIPKRLMLLGVG